MGRGVTVGAVLLIILMAVVKAHLHFIKLIILAGAGLLGLYLLHLLAQDYNKIRQPMKPSGGGGGAAVVRAVARLLFKRSVDVGPPLADAANADSLHSPWLQDAEFRNEVTNFDYILAQDPRECARKVVCELATKSRKKLLADENAILDLLGVRDGGALHGEQGRAAFARAAALGRGSRDPAACAEEYPKCPFSAWQMLKMLRSS